MGPLNNFLVVAFCWVLATGVGTWITVFEQPSEIERLESLEKIARQQQSEVSTLLTEVDMTEERADDVVRRWKARYRDIPVTLATHEVIGRLNGLTRTGFETFDLTYKGLTAGQNFNTHVFDVSGRAYFSSLYDVIWAIENQRDFYRVKDLELSHFDLMTEDPETGNQRLQVLVSFEFEIEAYYGGSAGLSAGDALPSESAESAVTVTPSGVLPPVPASVLPSRNPADNPFYPLILQSIPPNTKGLPELDDAAELVSIVDGKAAFDIAGELVLLGVGDPVYLGQIASVDPISGRVLVRLNKGGIIDEVEYILQTGEFYRQAVGPNMLAPSN